MAFLRVFFREFSAIFTKTVKRNFLNWELKGIIIYDSSLSVLHGRFANCFSEGFRRKSIMGFLPERLLAATCKTFLC